MKKDRTDRVLDWIVGILAGIVILGLIFAVTTSAHATPSYIGDITVADARAWSEEQRTAFVIGFNAFSTLMGVRCTPPKSMGEYVAAITHNGTAFKPGDNLADALFNYMIASGCRLETPKKSGA